MAFPHKYDPAHDQDPDLQDLVQGIRDPRVIRVVQDMQNRFDQRLIDEQQAADDRLQHLLRQQANDHRAQIMNLQRQLQDAAQQQQQQPGICMDITSYYGIVSYAVGVSLILTVAGISSGRRFFHLFNRRRRHAARHTGQILGNGNDVRVNHRPPPRDQEELLELGDLMRGMESVNRLLTGNPNLEVFGQEAERCSSSSGLQPLYFFLDPKLGFSIDTRILVTEIYTAFPFTFLP